MKIGIYGGSFDPIHKGHVHAAENFKEELGLDKVIVIPAYEPPHKKGLAMTPSEHRYNMCMIAFGDMDGFEVSDCEIKRADEGYMSDTIEEIRNIYPDDELYLLLGGDMLLDFRSWHAWSKIADEAVIAASTRKWEEEDTLEREAAVLRSEGAEVIIVPIDVMEISSTEVREAVKNGDDIASKVPKGVDEYIWNNYLYY